MYENPHVINQFRSQSIFVQCIGWNYWKFFYWTNFSSVYTQ